MKSRVLIIGGYGNFGRFIARMLAHEESIQLVIGGRNLDKAKTFSAQLDAKHLPESVELDINRNLADSLRRIAPNIVIHTSGPYQSQGYEVARACIAQGCHYIDLADGREFVANIGSLDSEAKAKGVFICSGASSVPTLTSAVVDKYLNKFDRLESLEYAITTAQRTNRGLATLSAILSYAGKPFKTLIAGEMCDVYGWMDLKFRSFKGLGKRPLGNCDIPDLELFPTRYPTLKNIRFQAGLELIFLHIILTTMAGCVRVKLLPSLQPLAPYLLKISRVFDIFGSDDSGFYLEMTGHDKDGNNKKIRFEIVARECDGLYIPSVPAILIAKKLANREITDTGTFPCMGFISLDEYLNVLSEFKIEWRLPEPDVDE